MTIDHDSAGQLGLTFLVETATEGGWIARALGASIFTEGGSLHDLHAAISDAVCRHFDEGHAPTTIRLRFKADDVMRSP